MNGTISFNNDLNTQPYLGQIRDTRETWKIIYVCLQYSLEEKVLGALSEVCLAEQ